MPNTPSASGSTNSSRSDSNVSRGKLILLITIIVVAFGWVIFLFTRAQPSNVVIPRDELSEAQHTVYKAIEDPPERYPHISILADAAAKTVTVTGSVPTKGDIEALKKKLDALNLKVKLVVDLRAEG
jgi:hypothetical protein